MGHLTSVTSSSATLTANLRTRSTGTVHATTGEGEPMCPTRVTATALEATSAPVTCRSCVKLQTVEPVCPAWCTAGDHEADDPDERYHWTAAPEVVLSLEAPAQGIVGPLEPVLMADLLLLANDSDARGSHVVLSDNACETWERRLTPREAVQLADRLATLAAQATGRPTLTEQLDKIQEKLEELTASREAINKGLLHAEYLRGKSDAVEQFIACTTVPASPAPLQLQKDVEGDCPNLACRICKTV